MTSPRSRAAVGRLGCVVTAALAITACSSTTQGNGEGAGAPGTSSATSSTASTASLPPTPAPTSTGAPSTSTAPHPSGTPTGSTATSSTSTSTAGASTYTGAGNPDTWCGSSMIAVTAVAAPGGNTAGHNAVTLRFLNNSHYKCILYGYPGVDGTNAGGRSVGHARRTPDGAMGGCHCSRLRGVLVRPGQTASALVEGGIGDGTARCDRFRGLLVTPPNTYASTPVALTTYSCGFQVHPVVVGSSGEG